MVCCGILLNHCLLCVHFEYLCLSFQHILFFVGGLVNTELCKQVFPFFIVCNTIGEDGL